MKFLASVRAVSVLVYVCSRAGIKQYLYIFIYYAFTAVFMHRCSKELITCKRAAGYTFQAQAVSFMLVNRAVERSSINMSNFNPRKNRGQPASMQG